MPAMPPAACGGSGITPIELSSVSQGKRACFHVAVIDLFVLAYCAESSVPCSGTLKFITFTYALPPCTIWDPIVITWTHAKFGLSWF